MRLSQGIRLVAVFEGAKGALILLAGFGLLTLVHRCFYDLDAVAVEGWGFPNIGNGSQIGLISYPELQAITRPV